MKKILHLLIFLFLCSNIFAQKKDATISYKKANQLYAKQDYTNAITEYEGLIADKKISAEIYYNLGNSYFKTGKVSLAILAYERAKKIAPDDEDIDFNLKIASLKIIDRIDVVPDVFYKRWHRSASLLFSANGWSTIFLITIWLFFISAGIYVLGNSITMKKLGFFGMVIFLFITALGYAMSTSSYSIAHQEEHGIVMTPSVYVKSSPDEKGNDLFILHEGTKVDVMETFENWNKIKIPNGTIGWLKKNEIEKI